MKDIDFTYVSIDPVAISGFIELSEAGRWHGPSKSAEGWVVKFQRRVDKPHDIQTIKMLHETILIEDNRKGKPRFKPAGTISYYLRPGSSMIGKVKYFQWVLKRQPAVEKLLRALEDKIKDERVSERIKEALEYYKNKVELAPRYRITTKGGSPLGLWRVAQRMTSLKAAYALGLNPAMYCRLENGKYISLNEHTIEKKWRQMLFELTGDADMAIKLLMWSRNEPFGDDEAQAAPPRMVPAIAAALAACGDQSFNWFSNIASIDETMGSKRFMQIALGQTIPTNFELEWFNNFVMEEDRDKLEQLFILE